MTTLQLKYEKLDSSARKEVEDFIDFLLTKKKKKPFNLAEYKKRIMDIPTWTDEDVEKFEENTRHLKSWKIEEW